MGIDEAGRVPVLGTLLLDLWCTDACTVLAHMRRLSLPSALQRKGRSDFENLKANESIGWAVDVIDPRELSAKMLKKESDKLVEDGSSSSSRKRQLKSSSFGVTTSKRKSEELNLVVKAAAKVRSVSIQLSRTTSGLGEKQAIYTRTLTVLDVSSP
ncbi:hypothetical protein Peur_016977 [Populus x canadensis]